MAKKTKLITVVARLVFNPDDLEDAKEWSREHDYTYERDGEIADMLLGAALDGIISPDIEEADLE